MATYRISSKLKLFGLAGGGSEKEAPRDLIAYKIFVKTPSGYMSKTGSGEIYKKNLLYEASETKTQENGLIGEGYFHPFPTLEDAFIFLDSSKVPELSRYSKKEIDNLVIMKILIPKGSKYYSGNYGPYLGNYASKEMILKEEIRDNRDWRTVGIPGENGEFTGIIGKQNINTNKITRIPVKYHNRPLNPLGIRYK